MLGGSPVYILRRITLPLIRRGMAAGLLLLWQNCARSQWAMAGVAGFCVIFQIIRIYKLIMK